MMVQQVRPEQERFDDPLQFGFGFFPLSSDHQRAQPLD
jgi:hypothetical protein